MKTHFLFPNKYKLFGWILFVPSLIIHLIALVFDINLDKYLNVKVLAFYDDNLGNTYHSHFLSIIENTISDELLTLGLIVGGLLICFSKLKNEDEYISKIRYESLVWSTYLNYGLIVFFYYFFIRNIVFECAVLQYVYVDFLFYHSFSLHDLQTKYNQR